MLWRSLFQPLPYCRKLFVVPVEALFHGLESPVDFLEPREYLDVHAVDGIGERRKTILHVGA